MVEIFDDAVCYIVATEHAMPCV